MDGCWRGQWLGWVCGVVVAASVAPAAETRDPWLWPFATDSIWNTPIGDQAVYVPAQIGPAEWIEGEDERLVKLTAGLPERPLYAPGGWETRAQGTQPTGPSPRTSLPLPDDFIVPDARQGWTPNNCMAFLLPDGRSLVQLGPVARPTAGGPIYGYCWDGVDLYGDGIKGSHGGSGLSAIGGTIRLGELTGEAPIRHALKLLTWCKPWVAYRQDDTPGYRWPALRADGYADAESYAGKVPELEMGALLAIPPTVREADLQLQTEAGLKLFAALRDYGGYLVDDSAWSCHSVAMETGVKDELKQRYDITLGANRGPYCDDINALFGALCVVDNNAPDRIGGGGQPRVPLAPPPAPAPAEPANAAPAAPPAAIPLANGDMSVGTALPVGWTDHWGEVEAARDTTVFHSAPASLRVDSTGGAGQYFQMLELAGARRLRVSGAIRCSGGGQAQCAVQAFDAEWGRNQFIQVDFVAGEQDWATFTKDIDLPEWTARFNVQLMLSGEGSAWLDDVQVEALDAKGQSVAVKPLSEAELMLGFPPSKDKPNVPGWCIYDWRAAWFGMHDEFTQRTAQGEIDVVFYGDSITMGWLDTGKEVWDAEFLPLRAVDYGIGGDSTRQLLWRIEHGEVDGLEAKLVVLAVGTNNLYDDPNGGTDEEIADGVGAVVSLLAAKLPEAKILVSGLLPRQNDWFCGRVAAINALLAKLDDGARVRFVDLGAGFLAAPGKVQPELFNTDELHLSAAGYRLWADGLKPLVLDMLR